MREFFHGWRRKAGCATIVMALALLGAWIRSFLISDMFRLPIGQTTAILSDNQLLIAIVSDEPHHIKWTNLAWTTERPGKKTQFEDPSLEWYLRWPGFGVGRTRAVKRSPQIRRNFLVVSYWSLAIPLTGLSAYLLLSKPRRLENPTTGA